MSRHLARVLLALVVGVGLIVHIGLGYRLGIVIAGIVLAGHLVVGLVVHKLVRRKADQVEK